MTTPYEPMAAGYADGRGGPGLSPGLESISERYNQQVASGLGQPAPSVLAQVSRSANGLSSRDAQRVLPGMGSPLLPTTNGVSDPTNTDQTAMRMGGVLPL